VSPLGGFSRSSCREAHDKDTLDALGLAAQECEDVRVTGSAATTSGSSAAWLKAMSATIAVIGVGAAYAFRKVVPLRKGTRLTQRADCLGQAAGGAFGGALSSTVAASSSSFFGSSLAGSVTVAAPSSQQSAVLSMRMMFERFNEKAIKAVMLAQEESRRLRHNYVGTEMLFVGVVAENTGVSAKVLRRLGVNVKDARAAMEELVGQGTGSESIEIPFTPAAKRVLKDIVEEARKLNSNAIDTTHMLLALMKEENGTAVKILQKLGIEASQVPAEILKELKETDEAKAFVGGPSKQKAANKTSMLEEYGQDLTKMAAEGRIDPLVGRGPEIERTIQILARRQKNNPVLIGEPGVGKTAIAEGLAQMIASGDVPDLLEGKKDSPAGPSCPSCWYKIPWRIRREAQECYQRSHRFKARGDLDDR